MKPKYIEENCTVCNSKLVPFEDEFDDIEDAWYCTECKEIIPDWSQEQIDQMMPDNPDLCVELEVIEDDLSDDLKEMFADLKQKFPENFKIMLSPQTLQQLFIMSAESKREQEDEN